MKDIERVKLILTVGRACKYLGVALVAVPFLLGLPGLVLLIAGAELFRLGEDLWNEIHRLPKKWRG